MQKQPKAEDVLDFFLAAHIKVGHLIEIIIDKTGKNFPVGARRSQRTPPTPKGARYLDAIGGKRQWFAQTAGGYPTGIFGPK